MNRDFNNIKSRFLLQVAFFILFCILAGGIVWFGSIRSRSMNDIKNVLSYIQNNLIDSYSSGATFQLNAASDEELITSGKSQYADQFNSNIKRVRDTLLFLENSSLISGSKQFKYAKDTFLLALSNYETTFNYLVLGFKEVGVQNAGNISSAQSISDQIPRLAISSKITDFAKSISGLKKYEADLLLNYDLRAYSQIIQIIDEIRNNSMLLSLSVEDSDALTQILDSYSQKITALYNQIKQIDPNGTEGLTSELQNDYNILLNKFESLITGFLISAQFIRRIWMLITILILLIAIAAYIILLHRLKKDINEPVKQYLDLSYNLSKGKLQASDSSIEYKYEFKLLGDNLNKINNSLKEKKKFIDGLLKQKFDVDISLQGKNDTFGKTLLALKENLRKTRDEQLLHAEQNQLRRYLNEGIAKFADVLRANSDDLTKLSDVFIRELVKYLEATQGGLFLRRENDEKHLYLASTFAYNRKKYLSKEIAVGEGLVGTCAIEMKSINLTEIPEDYIEITSGLGDTPPTNLLLLPVMSENELIGVIEIASLKKFKPYQIEAGERISENLASTIITARINTRTSELLKKSQEQAAEMTEQEEEMRQNMEELKATQEESARREDELEAILNSLQNSFYVLEYDTEGIICNINKRMLYFLNIEQEDIIGKSHSEVFGSGSKADSLMFSKVINGETIELVENIVVNNKEVVLRNTFSPVQSKDKKVIKVLNIISVGN
jgi:PAS domain-containing protein